MRILLAFLLTMGLPASAADKTYSIAWTKPFGGSDFDGVTATASDAEGNIYVGGSTASMDLPANGAFRLPRSSNLRRFSAGAATVEVVRGPVAGEVLAMTTSGDALCVATRSGIMLTRDRGATWQVLDTSIARRGLVTGIAVEPGNPAAIYVAAQMGGLWKTTDGGKTWTMLAQGREFQGRTTSVNRVYIDPRRPSTVYAIGGSYDLAFRSDDAGATWTELPDSIRSIAFDVERSDVAYASQRDSLLISEDRGQSWTELARPGAGWIEEVTVDPMRPGTLYLRASAIYRSTDRGRNWVRLAVRGMVRPDPASPAPYALADRALIKSVDAGDTWVTLARDVLPAVFPYGSLAVLAGSVFIGVTREQEGFVAKFSTAGDLIWATYVPASVSAITTGQDGSVYLGGICSPTLAIPGTFPCSIWYSTYVAKLTADGQKLEYAREFSPNAYINAIAVDSAGNAQIAGIATGVIPTTPGALWPDPGDIGIQDTDVPSRGFAAKFNANGTALIYSTYLGDWRSIYPWSQRPGDSVRSVVDSAGNAIAAGTAIWKLNPNGTGLLYSTRLDGPVAGAALDGADNLYVTGGAVGKRVYTTPGAFRTEGGNTQEVFITQLSPAGRILTSTLVGPGGATQIAVGPDASVLIGGLTGDRRFPTKALLEAEGRGFVAQFDAALSALQFATPVNLGTAVKIGLVAQRDRRLAIATTVVTPPSNQAESPDSDVVVRAIQPADSLPRVDAVVNAASLSGAPLAPGELIVIRGAGFGSQSRVRAGDLDYAVVGASETVLWVIVPDNLQPGSLGQLLVDTNGERSQSVNVRFAEIAPAIFTADASGEGQALAFNEDNTLNSATNPAARGSIIAIGLNGLGKLEHRGMSVVPGRQLSVYFDGVYAYGVDANLLPTPGIPTEVVFVKVYVPREYPLLVPQQFPRAAALWFTLEGGGGTVNRAGVWVK
jgi:hypothetical protein